jgi:hypothetical protein
LAICRQLDYGLRTLHLARVLAQVSPQNEGSISTLPKIGMKVYEAVSSAGRGDRLVFVAQCPWHRRDSAPARLWTARRHPLIDNASSVKSTADLIIAADRPF